ncbi:serine protease 3-like [Wyeomyia smithii]|uniref:serine protease 3-like n=1 Tax=Wyeomyia smithii TaxID=174621 RepID=UPI002467EDC4|nr:serine protease 3-like [Wyeomyia smithii]
MRFLAILLVSVTFVLAHPSSIEKEQRINNGETAEPGQFPYAVGLILPSGICGGSMISQNYVLTAAQCIHGIERATVVLGSTQIFDQTDENQVRLEATEFLIHPGYEIAVCTTMQWDCNAGTFNMGQSNASEPESGQLGHERIEQFTQTSYSSKIQQTYHLQY